MNKLYKQLIERFGKERQTQKAIEELAELIVALSKENTANIIEEIVDVEIMIKQLKIIYINCNYLNNIYKGIKLKKHKRIEKLIKLPNVLNWTVNDHEKLLSK